MNIENKSVFHLNYKRQRKKTDFTLTNRLIRGKKKKKRCAEPPKMNFETFANEQTEKEMNNETKTRKYSTQNRKNVHCNADDK